MTAEGDGRRLRAWALVLVWAGVMVVLWGAEPACGGAGGEAQDESDRSPPGAGAGDLPAAHLSPAFPRLTFRRPVFFGSGPAGQGALGRGRVYVIEQAGRIVSFDNRSDVERAETFLDLRAIVRHRHNEEGLLAMAFHPGPDAHPYVYVYYTASDPRRSVLARYTLTAQSPPRADRSSEKVILQVEQPWGNHNGGTVLFGPDGKLYLSLGDGGAANDPRGNGQNLATLLGSILRLDVDRAEGERAYAIPPDNPFVDRPGARGEIWAYGLRNVWRMSFDRATGDLWAGDVGQNRWEEIDLISRGGNYGWRLREGRHPFLPGEAADPPVDPVIDYGRGEGISVTGGAVYRGRRNPRLRGAYVYADYVSGRIWALRQSGGRVTAHRQLLAHPGRAHISAFGEDADGELYACSFDRIDGRRGRVYRLVEQ